MSAARTWIIADDLTGAADSGVAFVDESRTVELDLTQRGMTRIHGESGEDRVYVIDTDTRESGPARAREAVTQATSSIRADDEVFKKVDSLFRGEIAAELWALRQNLGERALVICPAVPAHGRRVRTGAIEADDDAPRAHGSRLTQPIREMLGDLVCTTAGLETVRSDEAGVADAIVNARILGAAGVIFDAETDADLDRIVAGARSTRIPLAWVGAAGLAAALARSTRERGISRTPKLVPEVDRAMVIVGSHSHIGRRQIDVLAHAGVSQILIDAHRITDAAQLDVLAAECARYARRSHVLVTVSGEVRYDQTQAVAEAVGYVTSQALHETEAVIISGGATARAVLTGGGIGCVRLIGELQSGVVLSRARTPRGSLHIVTKSGSFGDDQSLLRLLDSITR